MALNKLSTSQIIKVNLTQTVTGFHGQGIDEYKANSQI